MHPASIRPTFQSHPSAFPLQSWRIRVHDQTEYLRSSGCRNSLPGTDLRENFAEKYAAPSF
jgi:hypothetical protein